MDGFLVVCNPHCCGKPHLKSPFVNSWLGFWMRRHLFDQPIDLRGNGEAHQEGGGHPAGGVLATYGLPPGARATLIASSLVKGYGQDKEIPSIGHT